MWGFFAGTFQEGKCGLGIVLDLTKLHYYYGKANVGDGTNNIGELKALMALLKLVAWRGVQGLQGFEDSKLAIGWMNNQLHRSNVALEALGQNLKSFIYAF